MTMLLAMILFHFDCGPDYESLMDVMIELQECVLTAG